MPTPTIASALNHVAYATFNTAETVRFYTEVMGFRLAHAVNGAGDPEHGGERPFLHTFFAMGSGEVIAFFEIDGLTPPAYDGLPRWVRHLALSVESKATLLAWKAHLESHGLKVSGPVDHDGTWLSIYFPDPNGITLELTYQARALTPADAASAAQAVAAWTAAHPAGAPPPAAPRPARSR
jgi:catechol 2,3-dioxygenase-like lactoylglutathione lyase family enzyme